MCGFLPNTPNRDLSHKDRAMHGGTVKEETMLSDFGSCHAADFSNEYLSLNIGSFMAF